MRPVSGPHVFANLFSFQIRDGKIDGFPGSSAIVNLEAPG